MVTILIMSAKQASLGLLKIRIFQNKDYDAIIPITSPTKNYHVAQIIL